MGDFDEQSDDVEQRLRAELAKPFDANARADGIKHYRDKFDPWSLFPAVYGTYASDFDECAIQVLEEIRDRCKRRDDLGAEMFREMLCTGGYCNYGTSPRYCFWELNGELLDQLIAKWSAWSKMQWSESE